jgi:hypothetical protein
MDMPIPKNPSTSGRVVRSLAKRLLADASDSLVPAPTQLTNGDEDLYADKSGTYSKVVKQTSIGVVDPAAYQSFRKALDSGAFADFDAIVLGGARTLNGPQGGLAFDLECLDNDQFTQPPAPTVASETYATELVELYWGSLLRDVAFSDYATNATAQAASAELSAMPAYAGPRNGAGKVTPHLLFRGKRAGEQLGPYLSQFLVQPTNFGALPIVQQYNTLKPGVNFMTDPTTFQQVQNGIDTGLSLTITAPAYLHNGRGLASFTHVDVLYEAYFIANLVLGSIGVPLNPGNPYIGSTTQNGFPTFGGPDIVATLASVAREALKAVWYQKWFVHLRHRPESGAALVQLLKTGMGASVQAHPSPTVLNSQAVQQCFNANGTYFLSQAFPEGSPAHPAYPTGHGAVAGACITVLKFFYDGAYILPNPVAPSPDGTALLPATGPDAAQLTVNGELHKLASNVSFGHGIHAGIHWRSDTDSSIALGEAVALSVLHDRARTYNEPFTVSLTKIDGTTETITNV